jgi:hypothetical protein
MMRATLFLALALPALALPVAACSSAAGDGSSQGPPQNDTVAGCTGGFICSMSDPSVKGFQCPAGSTPRDSNPSYICSQASTDGTNEYCCEVSLKQQACTQRTDSSCPFPKIGFSCDMAALAKDPEAAQFGKSPDAWDGTMNCDQGTPDPSNKGTTLFCCGYQS